MAHTSRSPKKKPHDWKVTFATQADPKTWLRAGDLERDNVKELFMRSEFVEWSPFATAMKWEINATRCKYPVRDWVKEKKERLAQEQAENISDAVFRHKPQWHNDVMKVLRDTTELTNQIEAVFKVRVNQIVQMINRDVQAKQKALLENKPYSDATDSEFYKNISMGQLEAMARATRVLVEAKQRSVLINNWSVNVAEEFARPETILQEPEAKGFTIEIIGNQKVSSDDLMNFRKKYYDNLPEPQQKEKKDDEQG